ncbi:AfsR/SARP family transcriptional regulator [Streptomyces violascens]|uniref:AfsR/SARP family transcriptional regulator n=1 Tax=Streptomyces violascens TaxID=67381 RepID=UPI0036681EDB
MRFRILGAPSIYDEDRRRPVPLKSPKQRLLLGALLARPSSPVPTERLITEVWGAHAPDKAVNALQAHVSRLRQSLIESEPARANRPRLMARGTGYLLEVRPEELDCTRFRLLVARARACENADPGQAAQLLDRALALWSDRDPHTGSYGPLFTEAAARLDQERLAALELLYGAKIRLGRARHLVGPLEELAVAYPERPVFRDQLANVRRQLERTTARSTCAVSTSTGTSTGTPPGTSAGPRPEAAVRPRHDRVPHQVPITPVQGRSARADLVNAQEIDRLQQHIDRLTHEQRSLWEALERMTALVAPGAGAADPLAHRRAPADLGYTSRELLSRVLVTRPGTYFSVDAVGPEV